jgi:hypothetical protein
VERTPLYLDVIPNAHSRVGIDRFPPEADSGDYCEAYPRAVPNIASLDQVSTIWVRDILKHTIENKDSQSLGCCSYGTTYRRGAATEGDRGDQAERVILKTWIS